MMGKTYTAANGQVVTDEMIDAWCESYERGEFPDGEHTVGGIVHGRPPLSGEGTATLSVKIPLGMKEAIRRRAAAEGMTPSEFARAAQLVEQRTENPRVRGSIPFPATLN